jgi:hypothetical protein
MSSFIKLVISLATTALLALSWPPTATFAQGVTTPRTAPGPLSCGRPSLLFSVTHGLDDNFSNTTPADSPPQPSAALIAQYTLTTPNIFDQTTSNYHFGDTLAINVPQNSTIVAARLITRMKPLAGQPENDGVNFHVPGTPFSSSIGYSLNIISGNAWTAGSPSKIFVFTAATNILNAMTAAAAATPPQPALDVYVQDDTSVDFLRLEVCYTPPKGPDVAATKLHKGSVYSLNVGNPGGPIPVGDTIEVTDYIPVALTITSINAPSPWTCSANPAPLPVTGPAVITCTYQVTTIIGTGVNLPQIQLSTTGRPKCPNCMRVRLLRPGARPPIETNTANNISCVN